MGDDKGSSSDSGEELKDDYDLNNEPFRDH